MHCSCRGITCAKVSNWADNIVSAFSCLTSQHACYRVNFARVLYSTAIFFAIVCIKNHAVPVRRLIVIGFCALANNMLFMIELLVMDNGGLCAE